jgi:hypothetical protein
MLSAVGVKARFENCINRIQWPSHIGRLPKNVSLFLQFYMALELPLQLGENQSLKKADEWRRLMNIAPVVLWEVWHDENDEIPNAEPPLPPSTARVILHSRNTSQLFQAALFLCCAIRILACKKLSMNEAKTGQEFLVLHCRLLLSLGVRLHINHHACMHFLPQFKRFGPVYSWWLFAFERFNGMLEKIKHNGHDGGEMELTLLRNWVQTHRLYELVHPKSYHSFCLMRTNSLPSNSFSLCLQMQLTMSVK